MFPAFSCDAFHYADHFGYVSVFRTFEVSVTHQREDVSLTTDHSVEDISVLSVLDKDYTSFLYITAFPRSQLDLIPFVFDEGVHAVASCCDAYMSSFRDKFPCLFQYPVVVFYYCLHRLQKY